MKAALATLGLLALASCNSADQPRICENRADVKNQINLQAKAFTPDRVVSIDFDEPNYSASIPSEIQMRRCETLAIDLIFETSYYYRHVKNHQRVHGLSFGVDANASLKLLDTQIAHYADWNRDNEKLSNKVIHRLIYFSDGSTPSEFNVRSYASSVTGVTFKNPVNIPVLVQDEL